MSDGAAFASDGLPAFIDLADFEAEGGVAAGILVTFSNGFSEAQGRVTA